MEWKAIYKQFQEAASDRYFEYLCACLNGGSSTVNSLEHANRELSPEEQEYHAYVSYHYFKTVFKHKVQAICQHAFEKFHIEVQVSKNAFDITDEESSPETTCIKYYIPCNPVILIPYQPICVPIIGNNLPPQLINDLSSGLYQHIVSGPPILVASVCNVEIGIFSRHRKAWKAEIYKRLIDISSRANKLGRGIKNRINKYIKKKIKKLISQFRKRINVPRSPSIATSKPQMICSLKVTPNDGKEGDSNSYMQLFQSLTTFITLTFLNKSLWIKTNMNYYYLSKAQSLL